MPNAIKITLDDAEIRAWLTRAREKTGNLSGLLKSIGEDLADSTQRRFSAATAPDGSAWAPNTETTILKYLGVTGGNYKKDGTLSKKGQARRSERNRTDRAGVSRNHMSRPEQFHAEQFICNHRPISSRQVPLRLGFIAPFAL